MNISMVDVFDYEFAQFAGEIAGTLKTKPGMLGLTEPEKKKVYRIVYKYAKRAAQLVADYEAL